MIDDVASAVSWEKKKNLLFWGKYGKWWSEACLEMSVCIPQGEMLQHHFSTLWKLIQITLKDWSICFYWKCQDILVVKTSKLLYSLISFFCCCCLLFAVTVVTEPSYYCESGALFCLSHHRMSNGCSRRIFTAVWAAVWRAAVSTCSCCHMGGLSSEHPC